jgi:hypothetical protein
MLPVRCMLFGWDMFLIPNMQCELVSVECVLAGLVCRLFVNMFVVGCL